MIYVLAVLARSTKNAAELVNKKRFETTKAQRTQRNPFVCRDSGIVSLWLIRFIGVDTVVVRRFASADCCF